MRAMFCSVVAGQHNLFVFFAQKAQVHWEVVCGHLVNVIAPLQHDPIPRMYTKIAHG
jgi:hypothetical protein